MINEIICGTCGSHDFKFIDGKHTCQDCGYELSRNDVEIILLTSYQEFKNTLLQN